MARSHGFHGFVRWGFFLGKDELRKVGRKEGGKEDLIERVH